MEIDTDYVLSGIPFDELITEPLLAVAKAESEMSKQQVRSIIRNCFYEEDGVLRPVMLKMSITKAFLEPDSNIGPNDELRQVVTYFYLPMITIFPISSIGVDNVNINFSMEVLSQFNNEPQSTSTTTTQKEVRRTNVETTDSFISHPRNTTTLGRVATRTVKTINTNDSTTLDSASADTSIGATYDIDINAGPRPLTNGLLTIIDLYTKAIDPIELPEEQK